MAFSKDQKNFDHSSAFNNQLPHAYPQAPLSCHLPASHHPHQQFLQHYQTSQPYLLSHNHARAPGHLHWSYQNQQRSNGMTANSMGQPRQIMANGNDHRSHSSIPLYHEEDLISFDDQPVATVQNPRPIQQIQPLPPQPNTVRAPAAMMGQTAWNYPSSVQTGGAWQYPMDNTIHQTHQPQSLLHYRPNTAMPGQQTAGIQQPGAYYNFPTHQQPMNAGYSGGQTRLFQLPLQQVPVPQGVRNSIGIFNSTYKPIVVPGFNHHGVVNTRSGSSVNASNIRSNMSVQSINPQASLSQSAVQSTVQQKDGSTKVISIPIIPPPNAETVTDTNQTKQVAIPSLVMSKSEISLQQSPEKSIAKAQILRIESPPSGPQSMPQQKQTKSGRNAVPRKRSSQNKAPVSRGRNMLSTRNSPSKDSGRLSDKSPFQSVVAQEQTSKRIVRTAVFNINTGEVMQGAEKGAAQSTTPKTVGLQKDSKQDSISTKDDTASNSSRSTQQSHQGTKMTSNISKNVSNSEKRLLSFDELFSSSNNEVKKLRHPLSSPALEAMKDRPPSLYELMQLRNAAKAASKSSVSTISRSPSPEAEADQIEILEGSKTPSEQTGSPIITAGLSTSQPAPFADQEVTKTTTELFAETIEPAETQDPSNLKTKPTFTSANQEDMESSSSRPASQSGSSTTMEPNNEPASESVISTNTESTHRPSTTPALIAKLDHTQTDPAPCRFCPDEYRTTLARDQHEIICRRKAGWPKNCCFCGTSLSNRDALTIHAQICSKSRGEALRSTALSRYVASNPTAKASAQTTPTASPAEKPKIPSPAPVSGTTQSSAKPNLPTYRRRGARGKPTANSVNAVTTATANGSPSVTTNGNAPTDKASAPNAKEASTSTSTSAETKPPPTNSSTTRNRPRRSRHRGARKS